MFKKRSSHRRPSRRSANRRPDWSSSVVGSHAAGGPTHRRRGTRRATRSFEGRAAEVNQIHFQSRSVDDRAARHRVGGSRAESFMRRRTRMNRVWVIVAVVAVVALAFGLGSCAFRTSLSSSMALSDDSVKSTLVAPASDQDPYYVLLTGISHDGTPEETASFVAVMRVDEANKTLSLLNIPTNIAVTYSGASSSDDMLRDAPHVVNEGELVHQVSSLLGQDINHYLRITDEDFVSLVNALGGLPITVDTYVDDPTVGTTVLDPGDQTLDGKQALALVSAKNYQNGFGERAQIQNKVLTALVEQVVSKGGLASAMSANDIADQIKTDLSYDDLSSLAALYPDATVYSSTMPGSQRAADNGVYWSSGSTWDQVRDEFKAGEDMDTSVDTSGVDKGSLSIKVLNGAGTDGYSAQATQILTNAGYTIQETGNADSFVYNETLVIYRSSDDELAAEAIVKDLGTGRAVSAGVYYSLTTDIQVVVGKDWTSHA